MLMGYVEARIQNQDDEDEKLKCKWVQCPDMPEGLLTIDDETPHKTPKENPGVKND